MISNKRSDYRSFSNFAPGRIRGNKLRLSNDINGRLCLMFIVGTMIFTFGFTWMTVPLYRLYCQATGQGTASTGHKDYSFLDDEIESEKSPGNSNSNNNQQGMRTTADGALISSAPDSSSIDNNITNTNSESLDHKSKMKSRLIKIIFQGTVHESLNWEFRPQQKFLYVQAGETALAFYKAKNRGKRPIIGTSVYSVLPPDAGIYFNKIQCFCFDEQLINPDEEVDLPILFYLDPEFATDSRTIHIEDITLSYVFFESDSEIPKEYEELLALKQLQMEKNRVRELGGGSGVIQIESSERPGVLLGEINVGSVPIAENGGVKM